ncbi:MAG: hypothetical protein PVI90_12345, partial [Desulfobacteraceae bacterium]
MCNLYPFNSKKYRLRLILTLILCLTWGFIGPSYAIGSDAREKYHFAENCYNKLQSSSIKQKYRQFWLTCINAYGKVYEHDPKGPWAAAGLYQSGQLYLELYKHSFRLKDKEAGLKAFSQIIEGYPDSKYKSKALKAINAAGGNVDQTPTINPEAKRKLAEAKKDYDRLMASTRLQKYRDKWLNCIQKFKSALEVDPNGGLAPELLYSIGEVYMGLYTKSFLNEDKKIGKKYFKKVAAEFPDSSFGEKAKAFLNNESEEISAGKAAELTKDQQKKAALDRIARMIAESEKSTPEPDPIPKATKPTTVSNLRYWSNPNYTRIVIDAENE